MPEFAAGLLGVLQDLKIIAGYLRIGAFLPALLDSILSLTLSFTRSPQLRKLEVITWLAQTEAQNKTKEFCPIYFEP